MTIICLLLPVAAYFLGSVAFGAVLYRARTGGDIRLVGSGNIGATNVTRNAGLAAGLATLAADMAKGAIPVALARALGGGDWLVALTALGSFLGHLYPAYTRFKGGGKGVATAAGCLLALSPVALLWALLAFIAGIFAAGRVSVGSLCGAAVMPMAAFALTGSVPAGIVTLAMTVLVFRRHAENVRRIKDGTEPRIFGQHK